LAHVFFSSELVLDLTENDDCLVCGAYEAAGAGKPLVLSRKDALLRYFDGGTVFTDNNSVAIAKAIVDAYARRRELAISMQEWTAGARAAMDAKKRELERIITRLADG